MNPFKINGNIYNNYNKYTFSNKNKNDLLEEVINKIFQKSQDKKDFQYVQRNFNDSKLLIQKATPQQMTETPYAEVVESKLMTK